MGETYDETKARLTAAMGLHVITDEDREAMHREWRRQLEVIASECGMTTIELETVYPHECNDLWDDIWNRWWNEHHPLHNDEDMED